MSEQKHFQYEGNAEPKQPNIEVKQIEFLTPAKATLLINGTEQTIMVNVDFLNQKVYDTDGKTWLSEPIFKHLNEINTLPDDFFAAPQEIYDKAELIKQQHDKYSKDLLGEQNV